MVTMSQQAQHLEGGRQRFVQNFSRLPLIP
jgi:hypothetical protein